MPTLYSIGKILLIDIGLTNVPIALVDIKVDITILKKLRTNRDNVGNSYTILALVTIAILLSYISLRTIRENLYLLNLLASRFDKKFGNTTKFTSR